MEFGFGAVGALAFVVQGGFQVGQGVAEAVAVAELEFVEVAGGQFEGALEVQVFFGQVEGVEAVEQHRVVAGVEQQLFPGLVAGPGGFDEDDPGAPLAEVHAAQHGFFVAFDVDLEEVDRAFDVFFADRGQGAGVDGVAAHVHAGVAVLLGDAGFHGRQAGVGDGVEGQGLGVVAGHALQVDVFGPLLAQGVVVDLHRLDVDAGPAALIKRLGDRVHGGLIGTDVDVEAVLEVLQGAPQANVFEVLCIRNERHGRFLSVGYGDPWHPLGAR